jgi:hypothetical protein
MNEPLVESFSLRHFFRIARIEHEADVKITVSGMANDRCRQKGAGKVFLRFGDAFGQSRNRDADIIRPELCALAQGLISVGDIMARPPKLPTILRVGSPGKIGAAMLGDDHLDRPRLFRHADLCTVEFKPQRRRDLHVEL